MVDERHLKDLEDALRFSARANGWKEPDRSAEGLLPEDPVQSLASTLPDDATEDARMQALLLDFEIDALPEEARVIGRFAEWEIEGEEVHVSALGVALGTWSKSELGEILRRYKKAEGGDE